MHTAIRYSLIDKGNVKLSIYDNLGKLIKNLINENKLPGDYSVIWGGKDENNRAVAHGIYFVKIQAQDFSKITKVIVVE
jgi:flagellar hook assembly protein FlgD